jgi:hypothetical protein
MKGIKPTELDVCKANIMSSPNLRGILAGTVEMYPTFIKQMKAKSPQMNVLEVNYSKNRQDGGNTYSGKRGSSGISNSTNADVDDRFFMKRMSILLYLLIISIPSVSSACSVGVFPTGKGGQ